MRTRSCLATVAALLVPGVMWAQSPDERWSAVTQAWDEGRYVGALEDMQALLGGPDAARFLAPIALLTGERFETTWIAGDGRNPTWSPDGRFLAYEVPTDSGSITRVVRLRPFSQLVEVRGSNLRFNPRAPEVAYIDLVESPERTRARADAARRVQPEGRAGFRRLEAEYAIIDAEHSRLRILNLQNGERRDLAAPGVGVTNVMYAPDGSLYFLAVNQGARGAGDIWVSRAGELATVTSGPGIKSDLHVFPDGMTLSYRSGDTFYAMDVESGALREFPGVDAPTVSADGSTLAFLSGSEGAAHNIHVIDLASVDSEITALPVVSSTAQMANPALSRDGSLLAFQMMVRENWEVFVARADGSELVQVTSDDQHDLFPAFLSWPSDTTQGNNALLVIKGEGRHRRSYVYDLETGEEIRLFHNNTIRTVAPEYTWVVSPDGAKVAIVSERDGDTISPERALYVVDLNRILSEATIAARIVTQLAEERELRANGRRAFAPIADDVRVVVADVSRTRIFRYEKDLFAFGSKYITQPGNAKAIAYIADRLRSFGYEPELEWFEPRPGIRSANVIATLPGTRDPHLVYVISSHFDSVERGPGADDNTSGTAALLEAARVMRDRPMPRTIKFAFFTGEEAGLLGSRYFVGRAVTNGVQVLGALNNDMVGYANDARLDNTIRYSNPGIRDIQHAAAFLFTDLVTFDAKYYKSTDAHAYYDAYGDVVGGIGSYPILANPHYHQTHDVLETINHQLVAEVSKTTVATIMLLASSPSRLAQVEARRSGRNVTVHWSEPPESDVTGYTVFVWDRAGVVEQAHVIKQDVDEAFRNRTLLLEDVSKGATVGVKAFGSPDAIMGWDWGLTTVEGG